jgi:hypothetical protein
MQWLFHRGRELNERVIVNDEFGTNSMELSPSRKATSRLATQEFITILWNPKVPLQEASTGSFTGSDEPNPYHHVSILILYYHLRLGLPSGLFVSSFPSKMLYSYLFVPWVLHALPISRPLT